MASLLKPPRAPYGQRLLISHIDKISNEEPTRAWLATPIDESDLSQGFRDITYKQLASGANVAAKWLKANLGLPVEGFPVFAYAGPRDLRYPLFAVAAGKLGYQMMLPSSSLDAAAQKHIMSQKGCLVYLHGPCTAVDSIVQEIRRTDTMIQAIVAPSIEELMRDDGGEAVVYQKTWEEGRSDPWLVFHTSGTTGFPKSVTYSQHMMSLLDIASGLEDTGETVAAHYRNSRLYVPVPIMHYVSMIMVLGTSTWGNTVVVFGPASQPPTPATIKDILTFTHVDGAILTPAMIDSLCRDEETLELARKLKYIHYAGASVSASSGKLLSPYVRIAPVIGSTDAGGYFTSLPNVTRDWDYVSFHPHAGTAMEHRFDDMYELVFIRNSRCALQSVFEAFPHLDRFETRDLWVEHPTKKGQWKIVGRSDDFIKLSSGLGLFVTPIEDIIVENALVQNALVGGHDWPKTVLLIEPIETAVNQVMTPEGKATFVASLEPFIARANLRCHATARLDRRLIVFATAQKPWPRTIKDTVLRSQTLKMYETEIEAAYRSIGL